MKTLHQTSVAEFNNGPVLVTAIDSENNVYILQKTKICWKAVRTTYTQLKMFYIGMILKEELFKNNPIELYKMNPSNIFTQLTEAEVPKW